MSYSAALWAFRMVVYLNQRGILLSFCCLCMFFSLFSSLAGNELVLMICIFYSWLQYLLLAGTFMFTSADIP
jgi:hypothetical protein